MRTAILLSTSMLTMSLMWPSEGAIQGDGLHLAFGWMLLAAGLSVFLRADLPPEPDPKRGRGNWSKRVPLSLVLLVAGIWLGVGKVFLAEGDRRAAVNLAFEWTAIAAAVWGFTRLSLAERIRPGVSFSGLPILMISLAAGCAVVGIAQHHIVFPRNVKWFQEQQQQLDSANGGGAFSGALTEAAARQQLRQHGVPLEGVSRELFRLRLLDSTEPIGPFALANTLSGILAAALVLLIGGVWNSVRIQRRLKPWRWLPLFAILAVLAYCLVLTKSRTAWVGFCVGSVLVGLQHRTIGASVRLKRFLTFTAILFAGTVGLGIATGALDREVVLESPRSLQFRLFYWMGAAGVIAEDPLMGCGPGNFRQHYLAHKPLESSEEILDPHNIFLDAWCSGGLLGMLAILLLAFHLMRSILSSKSLEKKFEEDASDSGNLHRRDMLAAVVGGLSMAACLHVLIRWLNGGEVLDSTATDLFDSVNLMLLIPATSAVAVPVLLPLAISRETVIAAVTVLVVHLLGAGGLQIPALGLVLFLLLAEAVRSPHRTSGAADSAPSRLRSCLSAGLWLLPAVAAFCFGVKPVISAAAHTATAEVFRDRQQPERAVAEFQAAIEADPLSVTSRQRKMELLTYVWQEISRDTARGPGDGGENDQRSAQAFEDALQACDEMVASDRRVISGYLFRSRLRQERWVRCAEESPERTELKTAASEDMETVLRYYPGNATLWMQCAQMYSVFGEDDPTAMAADRALQIDEINRQWGHSDRYLSDSQRAELIRIAGNARKL
ncbi:MAG: O-antigen ligase family protein [Planctomycetaceae bacterium]